MHAAIDDEAARLGSAGLGKLALLGESQGACVALDAALSYPSGILGGVFASYGMLYSYTRVPPDKVRLCFSPRLSVLYVYTILRRDGSLIGSELYARGV